MKRVKFLVPRRWVAIELVAMPILGGASWLVPCAAIAQTNPAQVNVYVSRQLGEAYEDMVRRSEVFAKTATQQYLDRNIAVRAVVVTVLAENQGAIAPLVSLQVSRGQWQSFPDTRRWATYFPSSQSLLRFTTDIPLPLQPATAQTPVQQTPTTPTQTFTAPGTNVLPGAPGTTQTPTPGSTAPSSQQPATTPTTQPAPAGTQIPVPTTNRSLPVLQSPPPVSPPPAINTTPGQTP